MSRLEMNEPIEEIFADLKFDVLEKPAKQSSVSSDPSDDEDVVEDPDEIVMTTLQQRRQSEQPQKHWDSYECGGLNQGTSKHKMPLQYSENLT